MPDDPTIGDIAPDHLASCARLYVEVFNSPPWDETWTVPIALTRLQEIAGTPGYLGLGLHCGPDLVGFVLGYCESFLDGQHFYIKEMCVRADRQRQGLGTALMEALQTRLVGLDIKKIYLLTARHTPAAAFYSKQGFYVSDKMILMGKWLQPRT